jgi:hypothetical protein
MSKNKISTSDFLEIYFPASLLPELAEVLGTDLTLHLVSVFGGIPIVLPSREDLKTALRDFAILLAMDKGITAPMLAKQYGISRQGITQIYKKTIAKIEAFKLLKQEGKVRVKLFEEPIPEAEDLKAILDDGKD